MTDIPQELKPFGNIMPDKIERVFHHMTKERINISEELFTQFNCDVAVDFFGKYYLVVKEILHYIDGSQSVWYYLRGLDIGVPTIVDEI